MVLASDASSSKRRIEMTDRDMLLVAYTALKLVTGAASEKFPPMNEILQDLENHLKEPMLDHAPTYPNGEDE